LSAVFDIDSVAYSVVERELYATVTVVRSGDVASGPASIDFRTIDGTARAESDYVGVHGTLQFGTRVARATISIPLIDDKTGEPSEQFSLSLTAADPSVTQGPVASTTITIHDDETPVFDPGKDELVPRYQISAPAVVVGLRYPIAMTFLPETKTVLIAEKSGIIRYADLDDPEHRTVVVLDLRDQVNEKDDRGLLSIALHPDLRAHPYLYAYYDVDPPDSENAAGAARRDQNGNRFAYLSRFTLELGDGVPKIIKGSEIVLAGGGARTLADISGGGQIGFRDEDTASEPASNIDADGTYRGDFIKIDSQSHSGGAIAFGPDGALYLSTGDGSSFDFPDPRAANVQDIDSLNGKILRLDPLTGQGLSDNPFFDGDAMSNRSRAWAWGFRNPYTMAFAPDGRLFLSDTGSDYWEEINVATRGGNFGWPFFEGGDRGVSLKTPGFGELPAASAFYARIASGEAVATPAFRAFGHADSDPGFRLSCIVGAGAIYEGDAYPEEFRNAYFFSDFYGGEIYAVNIADPDDVRFVTDLGDTGPSSFVAGPDGYIYMVDLSTGRILRLEIGLPL
jgi:glucose/arabinose dehydrogenase